jgi:hypothetical protein
MVPTCHCAASLHGAHHATSPPAFFLSPAVATWPSIVALISFWEALREGLAASRQYEELRSRGLSHDVALREALGLGASPQRPTRATAKPLYFAGRA